MLCKCVCVHTCVCVWCTRLCKMLQTSTLRSELSQREAAKPSIVEHQPVQGRRVTSSCRALAICSCGTLCKICPWVVPGDSPTPLFELLRGGPPFTPPQLCQSEMQCCPQGTGFKAGCTDTFSSRDGGGDLGGLKITARL